MSVHRVNSYEAFHRLVPSIVKRFNEHQGLAMTAMVNPIFAMEELGISLTPEVAREVERRLRFTEADRKRLDALEPMLHKAAGRHFDPESPADVERILFTTLKLKRPADLTSLEVPRAALQATGVRLEIPAEPKDKEKPPHPAGGTKARPRLVWPAAPKDPLAQMKGQHALVDLLLEHRAIQQRGFRLASRAEYEHYKGRAKHVPISKIVVRLPEHMEGGHG